MKRKDLESQRRRVIQTLRDTGMTDDEIAAELGVISLNLTDRQSDSSAAEMPAKTEIAIAQRESTPIEDDGIIDAEIVETPNLPAVVREPWTGEGMENKNARSYPTDRPGRDEYNRSTIPENVAAWDSSLAKHSEKQCVAIKTNGERCRKYAIMGSTVCKTHGGSARHVVSKARTRIEMTSNRLMGKLIEIAFDDSKPAAVQLDAIKDGLNRAGLKPREQVEVGPITPAEEIFSDIFTGTREESRRMRGYEPSSMEHARLDGDQTNLVDHVLGSTSSTAPVDDHGFGEHYADYAERGDCHRPPAKQRRLDDDRRSMHRPEFHVVGEDALRIASDTRALPPGRSRRTQ